MKNVFFKIVLLILKGEFSKRRSYFSLGMVLNVEELGGGLTVHSAICQISSASSTLKQNFLSQNATLMSFDTLLRATK